MKKILIVALLILGATTVEAQELKWETNMEQASQIAIKTKKPLLMFFTGSDWCGWCIRLQKEVFKTPEFTKWANDNVVLVELDFPRKTPQLPEIQKQNSELQQFFAIQGYPTIWLVNATLVDNKLNFEKLGSTGYVAGGPAAWIGGANEIIKKK